MSHFTPEQMQEIATFFNIQPAMDILPVRDGRVKLTDMVWWRNEDGPLHVLASDHEANIKKFPKAYQIKEPQVYKTIEYLDK